MEAVSTAMHLPLVAAATYRQVAEGHGSCRPWPKATAEAMGEGHVPGRPWPEATAEGYENESNHKVITKRIQYRVRSGRKIGRIKQHKKTKLDRVTSSKTGQTG